MAVASRQSVRTPFGLPALAAMVAVLIVACASQPPGIQVVQERGQRPALSDALVLAQATLARSESGFNPAQWTVAYGDLYPISATNLAFNFEQAWMLCLERADTGAASRERRGFPMRVGPDGKPFPVSTVNWLDYAGDDC